MADAEFVAAAAGLGRAEQIVEVCVVPRGVAVPVETSIVHAHVRAFAESAETRPARRSP